MRRCIVWGIYEWGERKAIKRFLLKDIPVVEIGASVGFITNLAARFTTNQPQIALEANKHLLPLLEENIGRNGNTSKVRVVWAAIDYSGKPEVLLDIGSGSNLSGALASQDSDSQTSVAVPAITLGKLLRDYAFSKYTLISDIEGAEIGLLKEEAETINNCQQMIIELHSATDSDGQRITPDQVGKRIENAWGMSIVHQDGSVWVLQR